MGCGLPCVRVYVRVYVRGPLVRVCARVPGWSRVSGRELFKEGKGGGGEKKRRRVSARHVLRLFDVPNNSHEKEGAEINGRGSAAHGFFYGSI